MNTEHMREFELVEDGHKGTIWLPDHYLVIKLKESNKSLSSARISEIKRSARRFANRNIEDIMRDIVDVLVEIDGLESAEERSALISVGFSTRQKRSFSPTRDYNNADADVLKIVDTAGKLGKLEQVCLNGIRLAINPLHIHQLEQLGNEAAQCRFRKTRGLNIDVGLETERAPY